MKYTVRVYPTGAEWSTHNGNKLLGFVMGVFMAAGHPLNVSAELASMVLDSVSSFGRYDGSALMVTRVAVDV